MRDVSGTTHRSDAVIIGGGVMGANTAHYLAVAGVTDAVVPEADEVASGSSGMPA